MPESQDPPAEKLEAVVKKLAGFRNGLPESEQAMMDSLVAAATGEAQEGGSEAAAPAEAEVAGFAQKLQGYRDTLPEDERPLVDGIVIASGAIEEEVSGHHVVLAWTAHMPGWMFGAYRDACHARRGNQSFTATSTDMGLWSPGFFAYKCFDR